MTGSSPPKVLTVVVNYRTPDLTLQAVEAALREMRGIAGEILIVDNASADGSYEKLQHQVAQRGWGAAGRVRVMASARNGGFGAGNNLAIRSGLSDGSKPDFIYVLNSDAFPDKAAIRTLLNHMLAHPKTGLAGSYIHGPKGDTHITAFRFPTVSGEFEGAACTSVITRLLSANIVSLPLRERTCRVDWVAGASLMIRRETLDQVGLFDEDFFLYFEETDLCLRSARVGWVTDYVRESSVTHIGSVSTGMKTWARTPRYWFDSRLRYFHKNHGLVYSVLATLAHAAGSVLYRARCLVSNKPRVDPPFFLRDLIGHSLRAALHASGHALSNFSMRATPPKPISTEGANDVAKN